MKQTDKRNEIFSYFFLFFLALAIRRYFYCGFILGDDAQEYGLIVKLLEVGIVELDNVNYRFPIWIFPYLLAQLFGLSEFIFFLPTWVISSTFPIIAFYLLRHFNYSNSDALCGGLFLATAPFEVLLGTAHTNDIYLAWFYILGVAAILRYQSDSFMRGFSAAFFFWMAFNTKLWVVYFIPVLIYLFYAEYRLSPRNSKRFILIFLATLILLNLGTALFWKTNAGVWFPFLKHLSATFPVPASALPTLFMQFPRMIFLGSDFNTTLFGIVPYLWVVLLTPKFMLALFRKSRFDKLDCILLFSTLSFFLLLNFSTHNFRFDEFYSVPRIFRYLAPISFPISLHVAKLLLDSIKLIRKGYVYFADLLGVFMFTLLFAVNLLQSEEAHRPGTINYEAVAQVRKYLEKNCPTQLIITQWQAYFFQYVYLDEHCPKLDVYPVVEDGWEIARFMNTPGMVEQIIRPGALMLTGLVSYVHYGCQECGLRHNPQYFELNMDDWELVKEFPVLTYLSNPEPVRLWRWKR